MCRLRPILLMFVVIFVHLMACIASAQDPSPPQLVRVSPSRAEVGDVLVLEGDGFSPEGGGTVVVSFSPAGLAPVAATGNDTELSVAVPAGAATGPVSVTVTHVIEGTPVQMTSNAALVYVIQRYYGQYRAFDGDADGLWVRSQSGGGTQFAYVTHQGALSSPLLSFGSDVFLSQTTVDPLTGDIYGIKWTAGSPYYFQNLSTGQNLLVFTGEQNVWMVSVAEFDAAGDLVVSGSMYEGDGLHSLGLWRFPRADWAGGAPISLDPGSIRSLLPGGLTGQQNLWGDIAVSGDGTVYVVQSSWNWESSAQLLQFPGRDGVSVYDQRPLPASVYAGYPGYGAWYIDGDPCGSGVFGLNPYQHWTDENYNPPVDVLDLTTGALLYRVPEDRQESAMLQLDAVGNLFVFSYNQLLGTHGLYWLKPSELPSGYYESLSCDDWDLGCLSCSAEGGNANGCVGAPIRISNGNMRFTESDPLPAAPSSLTFRIYDSQTANAAGEFPKREDGVLGRGWNSVFDCSLTVDGSYLHVTTELGSRLSFLDTGAGLVQVEPRGGTTAEAWLDGSAYRVRQAGADLVRVYANGRLIALESMTTGRRADISYNGNGLPQSVTDSWGAFAWTITTVGDRIDQIQVGGAVWSYVYTDGFLTQVLVDGETWREYDYDAAGNLTDVSDSAGFIERHTYEQSPPYRALSSQTADESLTVEYDVEISLPRPLNLEAHETAVRVWGSTFPPTATVYYLRPIAGRVRTVEVRGDCSCGNGDHAVYGFDGSGHVVREQGADLAVTIREWEGGPNARLTDMREGYKLIGCGALPGAEGCRLDADTIMTADLEPSSATTHTWYRYEDSLWPDKATSICQESVVAAGEESCQHFTYDPATGAVLTDRRTGWTIDRTGQAVFKHPITWRDRYGSSEAAIFNPLAYHSGIAFQASWASEPQPSGEVKRINGPVGDLVAADHEDFVYYPLVTGAPDTLRGRLAARRDAVGNVTVYDAYDAHGNVTRMIDPRGVVSEQAFDDPGRLVSATVKAVPGCDTSEDPLCNQDLVTQYEYVGASDRLRKVIGATGSSETVYAYDQWRRPTTTSRGPSEASLQERSRTTYDGPHWGKRHQLILEALEDGSWVARRSTEYAYDDWGRLSSVTYPEGPVPAVEQYQYDSAGHTTAFKDANHSSFNVEYDFDPLGRAIRMRQLEAPGSFAETSYELDDHGNLVGVTDANGIQTIYRVDDFGRVCGIESPVTGSTRLVYNPASWLVERQDSRGLVDAREYDAAGNLTEATYTVGTQTESVTFTYDHGRKATATVVDIDGNQVIEGWSYERRGLLSRYDRSEVLAAYVAPTVSLNLQYDEEGHLNRRVRGCEQLSYELDFAGRPVSVRGLPADCSGTSSSLVDDIDYLPFGPPRRVVYGNQVSVDLDYDLRYRMTSQSIQGSGLLPVSRLLDYSYDLEGNLLGVTYPLALSDERDRSYTYDDMARLISASGVFGDASYQYDPTGNRTRKVVDASGMITTTDYTYETVGGSVTSLLDQITVVPPSGPSQLSSIGHDQIGNVTSDESVSQYTYTPRESLNAAMVAGSTYGFRYDSSGQRAWSGIDTGSTFTHHYLLPDGNPFAELHVSSTGLVQDQRSYLFVEGLLLARFDETGTVEHVVPDQIGFPLMSLDSSGAVLWDADAMPFGELAQTFTGDDSTDPLLRYPGQWADDSAQNPAAPGMHLLANGYRWYNPGWGRYLQPDPAGPESGESLYSYARQNPGRFVDPAGLAYFAKRHLSHLPWHPQYSDGNIIMNYLNLELSHEHIFLTDENQPDNYGFFPEGVTQDDPTYLNGRFTYFRMPGNYNDCVMRLAIASAPAGTYSLLGVPGRVPKNNCQDWAARVRAEYEILRRIPEVIVRCGCPL